MTVLIKRYANRKLYNTDTSRYITLKGIAEREGYARTSYEAFCAEPRSIFERFGLSGEVAVTAERQHRVRVKDYPAQPIRNMNGEQISRLSAPEIADLRAKGIAG